MKNILYIATSDIHLKTFHVPYIEWLTEQGHAVDLAFEDRGSISFSTARKEYRLHFPRSVKLKQLFETYKALKSIIESGNYDLIHCHTPIPSAITRLAAWRWRKHGGKVLYTAHGFHFYKGAPLQRWLVYYPAELILSHFSDFIVTINSEDLEYTKRKLWGARSGKIPGVGIQARGFARLESQERQLQRKELGFGTEQFLVLYVAEFIPRKNHQFIIEALPQLNKSIPNLKVIFIGRGEVLEMCRSLTQALGVQDAVQFLGFRSDVAKFAQIADVAVSASKHEGLGIALLEQMRCGVPVVASDDRGHREFIENGETGFLFKQNDQKSFLQSLRRLYEDEALSERIGENARIKSLEFDLDQSMQAMARIYAQFL
jgi:glycosyltransferase EpsD